jgi:hypothetical protein
MAFIIDRYKPLHIIAANATGVCDNREFPAVLPGLTSQVLSQT